MSKLDSFSLIACAILVLSSVAVGEEPPTSVEGAFTVQPIGHFWIAEGKMSIVLEKKYQPGLLGLDGFSHAYVFWWFDRNDTPEKRAVLQVHPMGNRENPLTGVFATRSPMRPNLIALTLCKIISVKGNIIEIEKTDAFDGTPVLDIKPFIPGYDTAEEASMPDWLEKARKKRPTDHSASTETQGHPGLHNVMRVSERIVSGSEPHGDEGFASIARLGAKTVVSVDGARPNVELAKKHGLRYVHIPIGYDGVPEEAGKALARLMREAKEPVYVHCHHGRHRGPAAAAVACIASGATQNKDALQILENAGTSKNYKGLWRDVERYKPPAPGAKLPELVEIAKVESLAQVTAHVEELQFAVVAWRQLESCCECRRRSATCRGRLARWKSRRRCASDGCCTAQRREPFCRSATTCRRCRGRPLRDSRPEYQQTSFNRPILCRRSAR